MRLVAIVLAGPYNQALAVAIVTALLFSWRAGRSAGLPMMRWTLVLLTALAAGYIGSRTLFLDFQPIAPGEKTNLGALLLGIPALVVGARALGLGAWNSLDLATRPTLGAMAIGRVGCFAAGCCAGTATTLPWAVADRDGHLVHPVQLYEAAADVVLLLVLGRVARGRPGTRFLAATLGYTGIRFATEFVRAGRTQYMGLGIVQWSLLALALALLVLVVMRASRAIPLLVMPQLGAVLMMQAPVAADPPRREIVAGGGYWRSMYDQTIGYEYGTDCDGGPNRMPTLASRDGESAEGMLGYRFRTAAGDRVTIEGRYQAGRDRVDTVAPGPMTESPVDFDSWAVGGAVMVERPTLTARVGLMSGRLGRAGRDESGVAPTVLFRVGDDRRWFFEANVADRGKFGATGEFSYLGLGYTMGRDRPRAMLGLGEGGKAQLFVPMAGFEVDLSYRSLTMRDDGSDGGEGFRIGVQRAIRLR